MRREEKRALLEKVLPSPVTTKDMTVLFSCSKKCIYSLLNRKHVPTYRDMNDGGLLIKKSVAIDTIAETIAY